MVEGRVAQVPRNLLATGGASATAAAIKALGKQLDTFHRKDLFLGRFRMLGRSERRQGGVTLQPLSCPAGRCYTMKHVRELISYPRHHLHPGPHK